VKQLDRILIIIATLILIVNYPVNIYILNNQPDHIGTFIVLILICIVLMRIVDEKKDN